jgi:transcriptional regulator with XRE-family HTH domain
VEEVRMASNNNGKNGNGSNGNGSNLGEVLKQRRSITRLTLKELGEVAGVSASYLGRIEQGKRFPSARVLHRIARHLGFSEDELLIMAGYLSTQPTGKTNGHELEPDFGKLHPYVARVLAAEPTAVQFTVIGILAVLKTISQAECAKQ